MEIRRLTPDSAERFRAIRLQSLRDAPDAFGSTFEETAARPAQSWPEQLHALATFVAVVDGVDVGIVRTMPYEGKPEAAVLLSMWVNPIARGKGVGEVLIHAVIDWARSGGFTQLLLDVGDLNEPASALYARLGFRKTGETGTLPPPREHITEHRRALELAPQRRKRERFPGNPHE